MAKSFNQFIKEADGEQDVEKASSTKAGLINFIVSNFYRFINNPNMRDDKALLMLIAALSTISASDGDSSQALQLAKRLAQGAMSRSTTKMKKEKE